MGWDAEKVGVIAATEVVDCVGEGRHPIASGVAMRSARESTWRTSERTVHAYGSLSLPDTLDSARKHPRRHLGPYTDNLALNGAVGKVTTWRLADTL